MMQAEVENARAEGARTYGAQLESVRAEREFLEQEMDRVRHERAACKEQMAQVRQAGRRGGMGLAGGMLSRVVWVGGWLQLSSLSKTASEQGAALVEWENKGRELREQLDAARQTLQTYKARQTKTTTTTTAVAAACLQGRADGLLSAVWVGWQECFGELVSVGGGKGGVVEVDRSAKSKAALLRELAEMDKGYKDALAQVGAHTQRQAGKPRAWSDHYEEGGREGGGPDADVRGLWWFVWGDKAATLGARVEALEFELGEAREARARDRAAHAADVDR